MKNFHEIRKADANELLWAAKQRLEEFPVLKEIYNDDFLITLIRNKNNRDNILLFWLVNNNPTDSLIAPKFMQGIENDVRLFRLDSNFSLLKRKLRQWKTIPFESAVTELEFAAEYCKKRYETEFEPLLPNNKKGDFCVNKDGLKIYFEVKMIFSKTSLQEDAIITDLSDRCDGIEQPFVLSVDIKKDFRLDQSAAFSKFLQKKLKEIDAISIDLPFSLVYPEIGNSAIKIDLVKRVPKGERGYIAGFIYGGGIKSSWVDVRRKIAAGVSQLHPDYPGVIIVRPYGLNTLEYDMRNALYGDLSVRFNRVRSQVIRSGDRIFGVNKNKRLSAVVYYKKRLQSSGYEKKMAVYHNPFALHKIARDVFEGENVTQS
jgi:hypothetical protein